MYFSFFVFGRGSHFSIALVILLPNVSYPNGFFLFSSAVSDEAGLQHVAQELEAKAILPFSFEK
jgi:hypothetical protein